MVRMNLLLSNSRPSEIFMDLTEAINDMLTSRGPLVTTAWEIWCMSNRNSTHEE